jgi:RecG-like helicase
MMSATPIPRTLAMSYYADLDVSVIDELPPGRTPVVTRWSRRRAATRSSRARPRRLCGGNQVYWVCPLIEESEKLSTCRPPGHLERLHEREARPHARRPRRAGWESRRPAARPADRLATRRPR